MTRTELTALTNQLMLAVSVYGDARTDVAEVHNTLNDNRARYEKASAVLRDADNEVRRLVRTLSALVPVTETKS